MLYGILQLVSATSERLGQAFNAVAAERQEQAAKVGEADASPAQDRRAE